MSRRLQTLSLALLSSGALVLAACGGGGNSATSGPTAACNSEAVLGTAQTASGNVAPITVDGGPVIPNGSGGTMLAGTINQGYTTVTVCDPNSPSSCQTIDHVWVDTGSVGLRLMCTPFVAKLPASQPQNSNTVANCGQFVSSYTWGALRAANVKIAGESTATSIPIQVIADAGVPATAPSSCSNGATAQNTVKALGANGILGIGVFKEDCGPGCQSSAPTGWYYTCPGGNCQPVSVATGSQLLNVVSQFPLPDNNGTLIQMQSVPSAGAITGSGSLIFGIGSQSNNALGSATVFGADPTTTNMNLTLAGDIQTATTFAGGDTTEPSSYIDSGSNALFFNDSNLTQCTGVSAGLFCPKSTETTSLTAMMLPYNTPTDSTSFTYSFSVMDITSSTNLAFNNLGGPSGACNNTTNPPIPCTFGWGMPFFYGRSVFTAIEGQPTPALVAAPYFAATP